MKKWGIVVDSSSDLRYADFNEEDIAFHIAPLKVLTGDKDYVDDDSVNISELLVSMEASKDGSKSACPSPGEFAEGFALAENIICITITGALSGAFNSANLAKGLLDDGVQRNIHVVDSHAAAGVVVLLMDRAIELIKEGKSFEEIKNNLDQYNTEIGAYFILGSFFNLVKTGRMSPIVGTIATHLNIKAICYNNQIGEFNVLKKVRGINSAYRTLVDLMKERKDLVDKPIHIHHCNNEEGALKVKEILETSCNVKSVTIRPTKALTSFYAMEGGVIVGF